MTKARFRVPPAIGWCLVGALAMTGCASEGTQGGETGSMAMNIDLGGLPPASSDETFETVQWVIADISTTPPTPVAQDQINVAQAGSTASFEKFGLPPGGYGVLLTATSVSGATTCEGQGAIFSVMADQQTTGTVLLNCSSDRQLGSLRINGEFNRCAIVRFATVSPLQVSVGNFIDVTAEAQDDEGDAVVYEWRSRSGTFTDPGAATTQYRCEEIGTHDIVIAVSDDEDQAAHDNFPMPTPADAFTYCEDTWTTQVTCVSAPTCPNGVLDPGEDCDPGPPPVGPSWFVCDPASCLRVPTCGDGIVDAGEACDPCDDAGGCDPADAGYNGGMPTTDPFCSNCQAVNACNPNPCLAAKPSCNTAVCTTDAQNNPLCDYTGLEPNGTLCDDFAPDDGICIGGSCQPVPPPVQRQVSLICSNNLVTANISNLPYELVATPLGPVANGTPVDVGFTGTGFFPALFLNAGLPFGITAASVVDLNASVVVRSGATQPGTVLHIDPAVPQPIVLDITTDLPTCEAAGFPSAPCIIDDLSLPLSSDIGTLTPNGGSGGEMLVGWNETDILPEDLPVPVDPNSQAGSNGLRLSTFSAPGVPALPFLLAMECTMGECTDVTCGGDPDTGVALLDGQLLSIPIP